MAIRCVFLGLALAAGVLPPAWAQTGSASTSSTSTTAHAAASAHHHAAKHPEAKKTARKSSPNTVHHPRGAPPLVAPRHGPAPRKPVHKAAPVAVEPKTVAKPVALKPPAVVKAPPKAAPPAKPAIPADQGTVTGLHLPRFASLKTDDVNMRSGPGSRYPVLWIYKRRELPVKIEREFDVWRLVEDMDGIKGWVHQATLTGRRSFVVSGPDPRTMRADASDSAAAVAVLKPGVVGRIRACDATAAWCQVQVGEYRGWLARADFWGTEPGEAVAP